MYAPPAPRSSARLTGVIVTAGAVATMGYVLTTGLGMRISPMQQTITVMEFIDSPQETIPETLPPIDFAEIPPTTLEPPPFIAPPVVFEFESPVFAAPPDTASNAAPGPSVPAGSGTVAPRLRTTAEPPYPVQSRRLNEHGVTGLELCVNVRGQVASARLASSSGHSRLDDAALQWVRNARFTPGSVGGVPRDMCGYRIDYEWRLTTGR